MLLRTPKRALLSLAVIGLLAGTVSVEASAQQTRVRPASRRKARFRARAARGPRR